MDKTTRILQGVVSFIIGLFFLVCSVFLGAVGKAGPLQLLLISALIFCWLGAFYFFQRACLLILEDCDDPDSLYR